MYSTVPIEFESLLGSLYLVKEEMHSNFALENCRTYVYSYLYLYLLLTLLDSASLPSAGALGKAPIALGKGFAECRTQQRALGKNPTGKRALC
jgi:hypothetical protein